MWLLNAETECLEQVPNESTDPGQDARPYAILSHRWLADNKQEVSYSDLREHASRKKGRSKLWPLHRTPPHKQKQGYRKVKLCCQQAKRQHLQHVWIDTCCINKADESETAEAIRSMYNWYRRASICYVYLADVVAERLTWDGRQTTEPEAPSDWRVQFEASSWFLRGWTLQELLAPRQVNFYNADWKYLGTLEDLAHAVAEITRIPRSCLTRYVDQTGLGLSDYSYAQRLAWAARRQTTRGEDRTYSLMGIFGVHMPVLYGEGSKQAFRRHQEDLFRRSADHSLLAWSGPSGGLLSPRIDYFRHTDTIIDIRGKSRRSDNLLTDNAYRTFLPIVSLAALPNPRALELYDIVDLTHLALLNCRYTDDTTYGPALCLGRLNRAERNGDRRYHVVGESRRIQRCPLSWFSNVRPQHISIVRGSEKLWKGLQLRLRSQAQGYTLRVDSTYPPTGWSHAVSDGNDPGVVHYTFWPRAPGTTWHTAAIAFRVVADADPFSVALVVKYNRQTDDAKVVHFARCLDTDLERVCERFRGSDESSSSSSAPPLRIDVDRYHRLQAFSIPRQVQVALT